MYLLNPKTLSAFSWLTYLSSKMLTLLVLFATKRYGKLERSSFLPIPTTVAPDPDEAGAGRAREGNGREGGLADSLLLSSSLFPARRRPTWSLSHRLSLSATLPDAADGVVADAGAKRSDSTKNLNAVNGSSLARRKDRRRWRHCEIYPPDFNFRAGNKRRERGWIIESETKSHGCAIPTFDQRWPLNTGRVLV